MPRQIIDTESSRPAYVARQVRRTVVTVIILVALVVAGYVLLTGHVHGAATSSAIPGNSSR